MKNKKTIKLTVEFGKYSKCLWGSACENNIVQWPDRYALLEGRKRVKGTFYFCDSYLEAKVLEAILRSEGFKTSLYSDEFADWGDERFVVACSKPFGF